jgi:ABC-2 type transport system permease protein
MAQGLSILVFGAIIGVDYSLSQLLILLGVGLICCLLGGAFGMAVLANLSNRRAVQQIFPFIMLPQYFLGGIFAPIKVLPWYLEVFSRISPVRYAADLTRGLYYGDLPEASQIVLTSGWINLAIIVGMFTLFLVTGTAIFVRSERNR